MSTYSIKDLEQLTGVKAHTIRIWEQRYSIVEPKRTESNLRYYNSDDLKNMLNITMLNNNGYKISKIAKMSKVEIREAVGGVVDKQENHSDQISALTLAMVEMDEDRFEHLMATNILKYGFEDTMISIIYPFLGRIGFLWQTHAINPAQEHFMTNLIRQKIIVAIDAQLHKKQAENKKFMLFLPEGELHEMSLLFANYIIRSRGQQTVYLGQSLPLSDLNSAYVIHEPEYIFSVLTSVPGTENAQNYVDTLADTFPKSIILLTGYQVVGQDLNLKDNVIVFPHFNQLMELLKQLQA